MPLLASLQLHARNGLKEQNAHGRNVKPRRVDEGLMLAAHAADLTFIGDRQTERSRKLVVDAIPTGSRIDQGADALTGKSGRPSGLAFDFSPMSTSKVGPNCMSRSAGERPALPDLNPACAKDMRRREDHAARQLDGRRTDLSDQIGTVIETLDRVRRGGFKVGVRAHETALVEHHPFAGVLGFKDIPHLVEGGDVSPEKGHR